MTKFGRLIHKGTAINATWLMDELYSNVHTLPGKKFDVTYYVTIMVFTDEYCVVIKSLS